MPSAALTVPASNSIALAVDGPTAGATRAADDAAIVITTTTTTLTTTRWPGRMRVSD